MKNTQNEKILQIKNETLVVGIDIGKETHYARAFDHRGLEQAKLLRFSNTAQGYETLETWMQSIMQQKGKRQAIPTYKATFDCEIIVSRNALEEYLWQNFRYMLGRNYSNLLSPVA